MDHGAALIELDDYLRYNDDLREHKAIKVLRTRLAA